MSDFTVLLHLWGGESTLEPAPAELIQAIERVEVTRTDEAPCGFQITFHIERQGTSTDYPLLSSPLVQPFARLAVGVTVSGSTKILIDGYVTRQELGPSDRPGGSTLTLTGEDVSVKMDLMEISFEWPSMGDFLIAEAVLVKYALLGIIPMVQPTIRDVIPFDYVPQQASTDRCYVQQLARENGYYFWIEPGDSLGVNYAHWAPPPLDRSPQPALSVDMGPFTNVESIHFSYNALAPSITYGAVQVGMFPVPVFIASTTRSPALSTDPALGGYGDLVSNPLSFFTQLLSLKVRGTLFDHAGLGIVQAYNKAQGITDVSTDSVVTVEGQLSATRYGGILEAPGIVQLRGAGESYDGLYYVKQVTHEITTRQGEWDYQQKFTLNREGVGTTIQEVT